MSEPWLSIVGLGEDGVAGLSAAAREAYLDRSNFLRLLRRHRMTAQEFRKESEIEATVEVEKKAA